MSPPGRPKGEYRSAQREGTPLDPPGRPKGEYRSAQREGAPLDPPGRPKGELLPAFREEGGMDGDGTSAGAAIRLGVDPRARKRSGSFAAWRTPLPAGEARSGKGAP
jgi:16S rRNA (guanine527-N7)-methyltransferase